MVDFLEAFSLDVTRARLSFVW